MKRIVKNTVKVSVVILVGLALYLWADSVLHKMNVEEMTIGRVIDAGRAFVTYFSHPDAGLAHAFPRDDELTETEQIAFLHERWHEVRAFEESKYTLKYYDPNIWTAIKNLPENPPGNLIVLATRNIDPSSLRTRLTDGDMEKHIRIDEHFVPPENLPILKKVAVVIYATGGRLIIGTAPKNDHTCRRVYCSYFANEPVSFDLTTNLVNGLQVKYLTTDGEVIPAND